MSTPLIYPLKHTYIIGTAIFCLLLLNSCKEKEKQTPTPKETETCSDGLQNQDETNVDCGGSCSCCITAPTKIPLDDEVNKINKDSVESGGIKVYISNFFTPNGDAINDAFTVSTVPAGSITVLDLKIKNECNEVLYETTTNVSYLGSGLKKGKYTYTLNCTLSNTNVVSTTSIVEMNK